MVAAQADCTIGQAIALIEERALANGQTVHQVAEEVVSGEARFSPPN
jgi:hypothetical protein